MDAISNNSDFIAQNWRFVPLKAGENAKVPIGAGWQNNPLSLADVKALLGKNHKGSVVGGYGVICGPDSNGLLMLDLDGESAHTLAAEWGELPHSWSVTSFRPGRKQLAYQVPQEFWEAVETKKYSTGFIGDDGKPEQVELRWQGSQSVAVGRNPISGREYAWEYPTDEPAIAPVWLIEKMLVESPAKTDPKPAPKPVKAVASNIPLTNLISKTNRERLEGNLDKGRNDAGAAIARDLIGTAQHLDAIGQRYTGDPRAIFDDWCRAVGLDSDTPKGQPQAIWRAAEKNNPKPSLTPEMIANCVEAWNRRQGIEDRERRRRESGAINHEHDESKALEREQRDKLRSAVDAESEGDGTFGNLGRYLFVNEKGVERIIPQGRIAATMVDQWQDALMVKAGATYEYQDGVWRAANADTPLIRIRVTEDLAEGTGNGHTASLARQVTQLVSDGLESHHMGRNWNADRRYIPLQDGVYDLKEGKMLPHAPDNYLRWQLPYSLPTGESALGGPIVDWLKTALGSDRKTELMLICMAATVRGLMPKYNLMVRLEGVAKSGKSTIRKLVTALAGVENTCVKTSLDDFNSRFGRVDIPGKRLICFPEVSAPKDGKAWEMLKDMVSGGSIPIEYKGRNQIENYTSDAAVWMDTNYSTGYRRSDMGGLERRTVLFKFAKQISTVDPDFFDIRDGKPVGKMAEHLPGLLKFLISIPIAWIDFALTNWAAYCPEAKLDYLESLIDNDPLSDWMDRELVLDPAARASTAILHSSYEMFCQQHKELDMLSIKKFGRLLKDQLTARFNGKTGTYRTSSERGFVGIRLREHGETEVMSPRLIASTVGDLSDSCDVTQMANVTVMSLLKVLKNKAYDVSDVSDISKISSLVNQEKSEEGQDLSGAIGDEIVLGENFSNVTDDTNVTGRQKAQSEPVSGVTLPVTSPEQNDITNVTESFFPTCQVRRKGGWVLAMQVGPTGGDYQSVLLEGMVKPIVVPAKDVKPLEEVG